jgi:quercetin dioxygenase-like cupin family protein
MADNQLDVRRLPTSRQPATPAAGRANLPRTGSSAARVAKTSGTGKSGLDWNLITLPPDGETDTAGADIDVMIHVLSGQGRLTTEGGAIQLNPGALLWLPRRSRRQFSAGPDGLRYLTVNQKWSMLPP